MQTKKKDNQKVVVSTVLVGIVLIIAALAFIGSAVTAPEPEQAPTSAVLPVPDKPVRAPKTWQTVATLSGDNHKRGELFTLTGAQSRLTYTVAEQNYPFLYVYLMDADKTLEADGGFAEVTGASTNGETVLYKKAGSYYLDVLGSSGWTVTVEELK